MKKYTLSTTIKKQEVEPTIYAIVLTHNLASFQSLLIDYKLENAIAIARERAADKHVNTKPGDWSLLLQCSMTIRSALGECMSTEVKELGTKEKKQSAKTKLINDIYNNKDRNKLEKNKKKLETHMYNYLDEALKKAGK